LTASFAGFSSCAERMRARAENSGPVTLPLALQGATLTAELLRMRLYFPESLRVLTYSFPLLSPNHTGCVNRHAALSEGCKRDIFPVLHLEWNHRLSFEIRCLCGQCLWRYPELPASGPMCYKAYMRKWMREKLNRRKKSADETAAQPAPLQPAYFEPEAQQSQPEVREAEPAQAQPEMPAALAYETESTGATADAGRQGSGQLRRPRRRRGRGGRGRKGLASQPAKAPTGADVAATVPAATAAISPAPQVQRPSKGVVVLAVGLR